MSGNRTKNLVRETAWFAVGNFGSKVLALLMVPLYTNILTTREYGCVDIVNTTISLAIPLLTLSLQDAAFRFALDKAYKKDFVLSNCLLVTLLSPLVLFVLYPLLKISLQVVVDYWWYFFWIYFFNSISSVLSCYLKGINKSNVFAIQGIIHTFVFVLLNVILLVVVKMRVEGLLLSILVSHIASCIFMLFAGDIVKDISICNTDLKLLRKMLQYSFPLIPASIAWWIMTSIDRYMLMYMCGTDANGLYSVAHKLPTVISVLTTFFINAWQITAVRNKDDYDISEYTSKIFSMMFVICAFLAFAMIISSKLLGRLFFAKDFFQAWTMTPLLTVATIFSTLSLFIGAQFAASMRSDLHLKSNIVAMMTNVVLNYILIRLLGINGAAYGTMISYFCVLVYRHVVVRDLINFNVNVKKMYTVCAMLMLASAITSVKLSFCFCVSLFLFVLSFCVYKQESMIMAEDVFKTVRIKLLKKV